MLKQVLIFTFSVSAVSCMATNKLANSSLLEHPTITVRLGGSSPSGIYRYDYKSGAIAQVVETEPTSELIKYTFNSSNGQTDFYLVGDEAGKRNLHHSRVASDGSATGVPTKILGNDDLNGPAICNDNQDLIVGQVLNDAVQVLRTTLAFPTTTTVEFHRSNFLAGDLHCRKESKDSFLVASNAQQAGILGTASVISLLTRSHEFIG